MVNASDIKVVLPCVFENPDPIWMMTHTCERFGIEPKLFGIRETYAGWIDLKVDKYLKVAKEVQAEGYSHILYSDARDAWFCSGLDEIAEKYNALGTPPILLSAQRHKFCGGYDKWYDMIEWDRSRLLPYVGTPGQLCEVEALIQALSYMDANYDRLTLPDDDPPYWIKFMVDFPGSVTLDHGSHIFMNVGDMGHGEWTIKDGRAINLLTDSKPSVLHFNGGSSDCLKGKWDQLEQHWRAFGYKESPPWES